MVCLSIILMGTIFKALHFPGANILILVGLSSTTFAFMPIALNLLLKATNDKLLKFVYIAGFISFGVDFIGMIFKIFHWPGASIFMIIGLPLPFVLFLPAYMTYHNKRKLKTDMKFFGILLFMVYLGVFSSLLAINPSRAAFYSYVKSATSLDETNTYLLNEFKQSNSHNISKEAALLVKQIEAAKQKLIIDAEPENKGLIYPNGKFNYDAVYGKDQKVTCEIINMLEDINTPITEYYQLLNSYNKNENTTRLIEEIETYRSIRNDEQPPLLSELPLIVALSILNDWQNKILLIEYLK